MFVPLQDKSLRLIYIQEWATRMVLEKEAKVESTAIRQMREEVKKMLEEKE